MTYLSPAWLIEELEREQNKECTQMEQLQLPLYDYIEQPLQAREEEKPKQSRVIVIEL